MRRGAKDSDDGQGRSERSQKDSNSDKPLSSSRRLAGIKRHGAKDSGDSDKKDRSRQGSSERQDSQDSRSVD